MWSGGADISVGLFFSTTPANYVEVFDVVLGVQVNCSELCMVEEANTTRVPQETSLAEPQDFPLLRPCEWQPRGFGELGRRQRRRMAAFENGLGDIGGEESQP